MKLGAVLVDIAIDQGGCFETSHPTSHSSPTYVVDGIVHYCVANMPAAVSPTATFALNNVTLPFTIALADKGWREALLEDPHLRAGLNIHEGQITCEPVAEAHGLPYTTAEVSSCSSRGPASRIPCRSASPAYLQFWLAPGAFQTGWPLSRRG
jgi:alanine dehydrogenase